MSDEDFKTPSVNGYSSFDWITMKRMSEWHLNANPFVAWLPDCIKRQGFYFFLQPHRELHEMVHKVVITKPPEATMRPHHFWKSLLPKGLCLDLDMTSGPAGPGGVLQNKRHHFKCTAVSKCVWWKLLYSVGCCAFGHGFSKNHEFKKNKKKN